MSLHICSDVFIEPAFPAILGGGGLGWGAALGISFHGVTDGLTSVKTLGHKLQMTCVISSINNLYQSFAPSFQIESKGIELEGL